MSDLYPETIELSEFLEGFSKESDRGAALVAASMLDERLHNILKAFMLDSRFTGELLNGFNAPLGTFAARASAAYALGLLQENEFKEITAIRKIRNEFGHSWRHTDFYTEKVASLARSLPWLGPAELPQDEPRLRFNFAVAILLSDLMWRSKLVSDERRTLKVWPNKARR